MLPNEFQDMQDLRKYNQEQQDVTDNLDERVLNLETDEAAAGGNETVTPIFSTNASFDDFGHTVRTNTPDQVAIPWQVPPNFNSIDEAYINFVPQSAGTATFHTLADFGAEGESWDTHSASDLTHSIVTVANDITRVNVAPLLTDLTADDNLIIRLRGSGTGNAIDFGVRSFNVVWS